MQNPSAWLEFLKWLDKYGPWALCVVVLLGILVLLMRYFREATLQQQKMTEAALETAKTFPPMVSELRVSLGLHAEAAKHAVMAAQQVAEEVHGLAQVLERGEDQRRLIMERQQGMHEENRRLADARHQELLSRLPPRTRRASGGQE